MKLEQKDVFKTQALNDGAGNYNYGADGTADGVWSSGRKADTFGGLFNDQQRIHYDGTDILVADKNNNRVQKIDGTTQAVTTVLGPAELTDKIRY